ncbi:hypothetical protein QVD17_28464 [Tagetes erecta]|uniref:MULE transposase domain-containing protein n=1 Tax=Tagetes erecta TaxID=13708 RepID=A0AAD8NS53_TARER|nr:hypothetical protein QVD17_28464 [Tagetes erecta]
MADTIVDDRAVFTVNFDVFDSCVLMGVAMALFALDCFGQMENLRGTTKFFGDIMSFDATYRSNRYSMVFVPFTGIDNHNNNVSFGAALLASETAETYKWLLRCFLKAFGKQPEVVVTDQDPAMKKAIEEIFTGSRHRLCMWHVMHKLSTKVGVTLCNTTDFKKRICDIVWTDSLSPDEFEVGWHSVIQDFDLSDNNWLADIYDMRESWIPTYYRMSLCLG